MRSSQMTLLLTIKNNQPVKLKPQRGSALTKHTIGYICNEQTMDSLIKQGLIREFFSDYWVLTHKALEIVG